jgi:hypothetical protein
MFVKLIRGQLNPEVTLIYNPRHVEFRPLDNKSDFAKDAVEELILRFHDDFVESVVLYVGDEVWITSDTGHTVDRRRTL